MNYTRFGRWLVVFFFIAVAGGSVLGAAWLSRRTDGFRPLAPSESAASRLGGPFTFTVCNTPCGPTTLPCPRAIPFDSCPGQPNIAACYASGVCFSCSVGPPSVFLTCGTVGSAPGTNCIANGGAGNPCGQQTRPDCTWTWITLLTGTCGCGTLNARFPDGNCGNTNCR